VYRCPVTDQLKLVANPGWLKPTDELTAGSLACGTVRVGQRSSFQLPEAAQLAESAGQTSLTMAPGADVRRMAWSLTGK